MPISKGCFFWGLEKRLSELPGRALQYVLLLRALLADTSGSGTRYKFSGALCQGHVCLLAF